MPEKDFLKYCETSLMELSQLVESWDEKSLLDVEYSDGILEIVILASKKTYIINRNLGNQKIWYSSPFSGADYFTFDLPQNKWFNQAKIELKDKLISELTKL